MAPHILTAKRTVFVASSSTKCKLSDLSRARSPSTPPHQKMPRGTNCSTFLLGITNFTHEWQYKFQKYINWKWLQPSGITSSSCDKQGPPIVTEFCVCHSNWNLAARRRTSSNVCVIIAWWAIWCAGLGLKEAFHCCWIKWQHGDLRVKLLCTQQLSTAAIAIYISGAGSRTTTASEI